jgi:3-hydroxymyristoyl/3-hydroxydecanoyl-(acyl carrier protein) dehydratase
MQKAQAAFLATSRKVLSSRPPAASRRPRAGPTPGLVLTRAQLEAHAGDKVSDVFGPQFAAQDEYPVQVRMPMPPLLLADRVVSLTGEPGSMGTGSVSTETDVRDGAWYLHAGRMTPGLMIEAGQADLLLVSYLGVDLELCGRRRYRLLGCDLTYHGPPARPGEMLRYDIRIDGHARSGDVRMFFFHYDCTVGGRPRMTVRNGQAGFFTEEELAASEGVLWAPETAAYDRAAPLDPPAVRFGKSALTRDEVRSFATGDAYGCFGAGFERAAAHTRTPGIPAGDLLLLDRVPALDHRGGPWGRGYLRAEFDVRPDAWFFPPHFKGDPCMPGTLMLDGCVQALALYLASLGYTVDRDGWRFEPVTGRELKLLCRGQVTPASRLLTYEVFVESVVAGDEPAVVADVLCRVDGLKAFYCRGLGLRLAPGWPLEGEPDAAPAGDAVRGDRAALIACALGRPSAAFGRMYAPFDDGRQVPRLPEPPYHFISRITEMPAEPGAMQTGVSAEAELDVGEGDWYFADSGTGAMPLAVLIEAALQPCGWLASFVGCAARSRGEVRFRNLDGAGTVYAPVRPGAPLVTRATLTSLAVAGATTLTGFRVECTQNRRPVFSLKTTFGFFPPAALAEQVGVPADADARALFDAPPTAVVDLRRRPGEFFDGPSRMADGRLLMLDRVTHVLPRGGQAGLGALRAEKDVDPREWFFKAHFFQDPVQPGSLGLEAVAQLLQFHMLRAGMHRGRATVRFEPVAPGPIEWTFRGQVLPASKLVTVAAEITRAVEDDHQASVTAAASLWVDGLRIYHAKSIGMRLVGTKRTPAQTAPEVRESAFDPAADPWVRDHCPTYVLPVMPMTGLADRLAEAVVRDRPALRVVGLRDVRAFRWLACDRARRLRTECAPRGVGEWRTRLLADAEAGWESIAAGTVLTADEWPAPSAPPPPLDGGGGQPCPYRGGRLFHGPAFQYLRGLTLGRTGSSFHLDPAAGSVPAGVLGPGLLDAATHGIPHDRLGHWCPELPRGLAGYPQAIREARFFGPVPAAPVRGEARVVGLTDSVPPRVLVRVTLVAADHVWAELLVEEVGLPMGFLAEVAPADRVAFLRDRTPVRGVGLTHREGDATVLSRRAAMECDWLPGTLARLYGADPAGDLCRSIAVKEHVAGRERLHPSAVGWGDGQPRARAAAGSYPVHVEDDGETIRVRDASPAGGAP